MRDSTRREKCVRQKCAVCPTEFKVCQFRKRSFILDSLERERKRRIFVISLFVFHCAAAAQSSYLLNSFGFYFFIIWEKKRKVMSHLKLKWRSLFHSGHERVTVSAEVSFSFSPPASTGLKLNDNFLCDSLYLMSILFRVFFFFSFHSSSFFDSLFGSSCAIVSIDPFRTRWLVLFFIFIFVLLLYSLFSFFFFSRPPFLWKRIENTQ